MRTALRSTVINLVASALLLAAAYGQEPMKPTPVDPTAFDVIGISVRTNNAIEREANGEIPKLWQRLFMQGVLTSIPNRADDGVVAVYTDYASDANGDYTYILGSKVKPGTKAPNGMVAVSVPAGKYLEFVTSKGPGAEVVPPTWMNIYAYFQSPDVPKRAFKVDYEVYADVSDPNAMQGRIFIGVK